MKSRSGFTLIELMVVVGIMILIATIVVSGSFGMSRASSYIAAENVVYNTLQAARQKACTDGKRVIVAFIRRTESGGDVNFALVTVQAAGQVSDVETKYLYDRGSLMGEYSGGEKNKKDSVWNLTTGGRAEGPFKINELKGDLQLTDKIPRGTPAGKNQQNGPKYGYDVVQIEFDNAFNLKYWHEGDTYGFQVGEIQELPLGFKFGFGSVTGSPEGQLVVFEPDGRSFYGKAAANGISQSNPANIFLYEEIARDKAIKIVVNNGSITRESKNQ